ncbi:hypothetical protein IFO70_12260 [Phormidium tenue FACHB-886]|nr:hypothetical protein [Phormidium tenue FACHB-886]
MRESQAGLQEIYDTLRSISVEPHSTSNTRVTQTPPQAQPAQSQTITTFGAGRSPKSSQKSPSNVSHLNAHSARQRQQSAYPTERTAGQPTHLSTPVPSQSRKSTPSQTQRHFGTAPNQAAPNQAVLSQAVPNPTYSQTQSSQTQSSQTQSQAPETRHSSPRSIDLPHVPARSSSTQPAVTHPLPSTFAAEPDEPIWDGQADWQSYPSHRADPVADSVARLQEKSTQYLQQLAQAVWDSPAQQMDAAIRQLEAQAQHVNELANTQEAALLELKAIAKQIEHDWKTVELANAARHGYSVDDLQVPNLCDYGQTSVPQVGKDDRGVLVVSARSIDWFKAEREAELTAQALRHRATQDNRRSKPSWTKAFSRWLIGTSSKSAAANRKARSKGATHRRKPQSFGIREGATLVVVAMVVRVLLNLLVVAHPALQFPAIALMVTPGAIALYRSTVTPKSMSIWGWRLVSIMLGLWLAGRLFL